jgi:Uma2 family endonuclease
MNVASPSPDLHDRLRIRVDEYHRMIEAGILGEDEHVQLIDGLLVAMSPQGRPHAFVIQELNRHLVRALPDEFEASPEGSGEQLERGPRLFAELGREFKVLTQLPLTLLGDSEPEPDLAVVHARDAASRTEHPTTALLVIEVAGESLRFDRQSKAALYARAGVPEYWIVNLAEAKVEVHRKPDAPSANYREMLVFHRGEILMATVVPGIRVEVAVLFPEP